MLPLWLLLFECTAYSWTDGELMAFVLFSRSACIALQRVYNFTGIGGGSLSVECEGWRVELPDGGWAA